MKDLVLKAEPRTVLGKQVKALRRQGQLPAVIYGLGHTPISISLDLREASRVLPTITSSQLVIVDVNGSLYTTLVREKQRQPITSSLIHIDFQEVSLTEKFRTNVMIELMGEAPAVKNLNGVLVAARERVEVEALPRDLPDRLTVDISGLVEIGDTLHIRDLILPARVQIMDDPDEVIVVVTGQAAEEVEIEVASAAAEPDVVERGKKEEEF